MMRLGVYSISLPESTLTQAVTAIRSAGCSGVEWRVSTDADRGIAGDQHACTIPATAEAAAHAAKLCADAGLDMLGLGTYLDTGDVAGVEHCMTVAAAAQAPWVRLRSPWRGANTYREALAWARDFFTQVAELSERHDVRALVELHQRTITPSASLAERLVTGFDPARIGVIYDAGNLIIEGYEDHRTALEVLGEYVAHVHLKNVAFDRPPGGGVWAPRWAPMDDGVLDVPRFLEVLDDAGYQAWVSIEEFSTDRAPKQALSFNAEYLRRHGNFAQRHNDSGVEKS